MIEDAKQGIIFLLAVGVAILFIICVFAVIWAADLYVGGYRFDTPLIEKTVTVANFTDTENIGGMIGFIDTEGVGYSINHLAFPQILRLYKGGTYNVSYFCGVDNNIRTVVFLDEIPPPPTPTPVPTPNVFICRIVNGTCVE